MNQLEKSEIYAKAIAVWDRIRISMPDNPILQGWSSFSQCDEDGIIRECLKRIAEQTPLSRTFIEVGCADGIENNSHQLLLDGFSGVWVDGNAKKIEALKKQLGGLSFKVLTVMNQFIALDNIHDLVRDSIRILNTDNIDFFSFDIDGNDLHLVQESLKIIHPKLVCVEYNGNFPPPTRLTMEYNPGHRWGEDDYYSASLQSWVDALSGYALVCCNLSGVNAFFVRKDLLRGFTTYPVLEIYQPPRYWLASGPFGHKRSLKWLKQTLQA